MKQKWTNKNSILTETQSINSNKWLKQAEEYSLKTTWKNTIEELKLEPFI